jgi:hypothetical protein
MFATIVVADFVTIAISIVMSATVAVTILAARPVDPLKQ